MNRLFYLFDIICNTVLADLKIQIDINDTKNLHPAFPQFSFSLLDFPFHFHVCWVCHEVSRLWRGLVSTGFTWRGPCLKLYTPSSKEKNTSHRRRNDLHMMFWCQFNISVWRQNKSVFFKMLSSKYFSSFDSGDKHFLQIWDKKLVENSLVV